MVPTMVYNFVYGQIGYIRMELYLGKHGLNIDYL